MISAQIDTRKLEHALKMYAKARKGKSYSYIVNRMLRNVAANAIRFTGHADATKIGWMLGHVGNVIGKETKNGFKRYATSTSRKRKIYAEDSFARRIVLARMRDKGEKLTEAEIESKWKKLLSARVGAVHFIRSGWLPGFKELVRLTKGDKAPIVDNVVRVKGTGPKGYAVPATVGTSVSTGEIGNSAQGAVASGFGQPGVQQAVNFVAQDMLDFAVKELVKQGQMAGLNMRPI